MTAEPLPAAARDAAPDAVLAPLAAADFPAIRALAHEIWHEHYAAIISPAQIDFMLARRCTDEALGAYLDAADRRFDILRVAGVPAGYCSHVATSMDGVLKLEQLYLQSAHRGRGFGRLMLARVESRARELGRRVVLLQVNKRNARAIDFYHRAGFVVREAAVFDIGGGFVMDDYVLAKTLG